MLVLRIKWWSPNTHLVAKNYNYLITLKHPKTTNQPRIYGLVAGLFQEQGTQECPRMSMSANLNYINIIANTIWQLLRQTKISHFHVPLIIHQNVLRFQVAVNYLHKMQVLECHHNGASVKLRVLFAEPFLIPQMLEQFTTTHELHHEE
jgi:hypothetical protein